jgi:hypothetical protein
MTVDVLESVASPQEVTVSATVLEQLLMLDKRERIELAHALLDSIDDNDDMDESDRSRLDAAIEQSVAEIEARQTVALAEAIAALRAKRTRPSG